MNIQKYENILIAFDTDNEMVNATDMLKAFPGKRMNNFLRQKQTKEFIKELENSDALKGVSADNQAVILIKGGGDKQGTWMHRLLAYKFASFLSPRFELFVYKVFDEAFKQKLRQQQMQLDYFWDKQDQKDLYE